MAVVVAKTVAVFVGVRLALTATSERYDVRTEHYLERREVLLNPHLDCHLHRGEFSSLHLANP